MNWREYAINRFFDWHFEHMERKLNKRINRLQRRIHREYALKALEAQRAFRRKGSPIR